MIGCLRVRLLSARQAKPVLQTRLHDFSSLTRFLQACLVSILHYYRLFSYHRSLIFFLPFFFFFFIQWKILGRMGLSFWRNDLVSSLLFLRDIYFFHFTLNLLYLNGSYRNIYFINCVYGWNGIRETFDYLDNLP